MNKGSSSNGMIIAVLILIVVVMVGWLAYSQGWLDSKQEKSDGIEVKIGGSSNN